MNIEAALVILVLVLFLARKPITRAAKRQLNKALDKLGELIWSGIKALGRATWTLVLEAARSVRLA